MYESHIFILKLQDEIKIEEKKDEVEEDNQENVESYSEMVLAWLLCMYIRFLYALIL